jgi:hypothetical protein
LWWVTISLLPACSSELPATSWDGPEHRGLPGLVVYRLLTNPAQVHKFLYQHEITIDGVKISLHTILLYQTPGPQWQHLLGINSIISSIINSYISTSGGSTWVTPGYGVATVLWEGDTHWMTWLLHLRVSQCPQLFWLPLHFESSSLTLHLIGWESSNPTPLYCGLPNHSQRLHWWSLLQFGHSHKPSYPLWSEEVYNISFIM